MGALPGSAFEGLCSSCLLETPKRRSLDRTCLGDAEENGSARRLAVWRRETRAILEGLTPSASRAWFKRAAQPPAHEELGLSGPGLELSGTTHCWLARGGVSEGARKGLSESYQTNASPSRLGRCDQPKSAGAPPLGGHLAMERSPFTCDFRRPFASDCCQTRPTSVTSSGKPEGVLIDRGQLVKSVSAGSKTWGPRGACSPSRFVLIGERASDDKQANRREGEQSLRSTAIEALAQPGRVSQGLPSSAGPPSAKAGAQAIRLRRLMG